MPRTSCCRLKDVKPLRLVILLGSVATFAATVPEEPVEVGLMAPIYQAAPVIYGR